MILIDTSLFIAFVNKDDKSHDRSVEIMKDMSEGKYGQRITLDYVLDEAITIAWIGTKKQDVVRNLYEIINGTSSLFTLEKESYMVIEEAWIIYKKYFSPRKPLSFTDCVLIAYAKKMKIDKIASFDDEFDGIIERIY